MAKRKRLTPANPAFLSTSAPETKSALGPGGSWGGTPPVAQIAGATAAASALEEVTEALTKARAEGRLIQQLPLDSVEGGYLTRDRMGVDEDELQVLVSSLRARGQQTPIEVAELEDGRFGLISGWRRLTALRRLHAETGDDRFATVQAILRAPRESSDAYVAMVEENEIRVGLSFYERARVVALAAAQGIFPSEQQALKTLFASASRAKRSKIGSFLTLYHQLDGLLAFPAAISERQGLALCKLLDADAGLSPRLRDRLRKAAPESAEAEQTVLARVVASGGVEEDASVDRAEKPRNPTRDPQETPAAEVTELRTGVFLEISGDPAAPRIALWGSGVDAAFQDALEQWLRGDG